MPVPGHQPGCETRTFKMRCPDCGKQVWYFDCTCGSKVFFDALGEPWPRHMDSCPVYSVKLMMDEGYSAPHILQVLEKYAVEHHKEIDCKAVTYLKRMGSGGSVRKKNVIPSLSPCEIDGVLVENNKINFYKRLDLLPNIFIDTILGKFIAEPYCELVVEEEISPQKTYVNRWTFVIPESDLGNHPPRIGSHITGSIIGDMLFEDELIWCADEIDWV